MLQDVAQHCSPELKSKISRSLPAVNKTKSRIRPGRGGSRSHQGEVGFLRRQIGSPAGAEEAATYSDCVQIPSFPRSRAGIATCRPEVFPGVLGVPIFIVFGSRNIRPEAGRASALLLAKRGGTLSPTRPLTVDLTANLKEINTPLAGSCPRRGQMGGGCDMRQVAFLYQRGKLSCNLDV